MALDPSIYGLIGRGVKSVGDYDMEAAQLDNARAAGEANKLALLLNRQKADEYTRGVQEQNQLRQALAGATTHEDRIERARRTGTGAGFALAASEEKGLLERQKTASQIAKEASEQKAKDYETGRKRYEHRIAGLAQFQDTEGAKQWLADSVVKGDLSMDEATRMIQKIPMGDTAAFGQWKNNTIFALQDAAKQAGYIKPDANATLSAETSAANNAATNARLAAEGAANREVQKRGQDLQKNARDTKAKAPPKLSPTEQKELFEADDMSLAAKNAADMLRQALTYNKDAYEGYGAGARATLRSNLNFAGGPSKNADATVQLDNLMTGQALESLKSTFGAMPTEGERKVLLEMQASPGKTAGQRKDIIDRAIKMAERRMKFNQEKAKALRAGTYTTEGVTMPGDDALSPAQGSPLGASSRVGGQAPRRAAAPTAPAGRPTVSNW